MVVLADIKTVEQGSAWVRDERIRHGWTAKDVAEKISDAARSTGDDLSLTQQAISFFETGRTKSLPRWLRYFDLVLTEAAVDDRDRFFGGLADDDDYELLTDDEHELVTLYRGLGSRERGAIVTLARSIATGEQYKTVHAPAHAYHAEPASSDQLRGPTHQAIERALAEALDGPVPRRPEARARYLATVVQQLLELPEDPEANTDNAESRDPAGEHEVGPAPRATKQASQR